MRRLIWVLVASCLLVTACEFKARVEGKRPMVCANCKGWCEMNPYRQEGPEYQYPQGDVLCVCDCDGLGE